ncbi:hypothetical protein PTQ21_08625 [Paenibacillus marchantiae]|uniref:hypothetical protein n=1 Tax=Paenibacillus marchantiae TaxID=3026433 RepID=UPI00237AF0EC|nr:hypothetical protein [Paenibacillus marchantiae]WDQ34292.1 hypothetical protein PTQ21_08625 [Paenibacillus marchantiae]
MLFKGLLPSLCSLGNLRATLLVTSLTRLIKRLLAGQALRWADRAVGRCGPLLAAVGSGFLLFPLSRGNPAPKADASLPLLRFRPPPLQRSPLLFKGLLPSLCSLGNLRATLLVTSLTRLIKRLLAGQALRWADRAVGRCGPLLAAVGSGFLLFPLSRGNPAPKADASLPLLRFRPPPLQRSLLLFKGLLPSLCSLGNLKATLLVTSLTRLIKRLLAGRKLRWADRAVGHCWLGISFIPPQQGKSRSKGGRFAPSAPIPPSSAATLAIAF